MLSVYRTRSSVDRYYYQIATHIFLRGSPQEHCLNWRSKGTKLNVLYFPFFKKKKNKEQH